MNTSYIKFFGLLLASAIMSLSSQSHAQVYRNTVTLNETSGILGNSLFETRMSKNGRFAVLSSRKDDGSLEPVLVRRDMLTGDLIKIGASSLGYLSAGDPVRSFDVSDNGQAVIIRAAKTSKGTNVANVFLLNFDTGSLKLISKESDGTARKDICSSARISANGRYVFYTAYSRLTTEGAVLYRYDLQNDAEQKVVIGIGGAIPNGLTHNYNISSDGNYVVFESSAVNLTSFPSGVKKTTSANYLSYIKDMSSGITKLLAFPSGITTTNLTKIKCPSVSDDGKRVAFAGYPTQFGITAPSAMLQTMLLDTTKGTFEVVSISPANNNPFEGMDTYFACSAEISGGGRYVAFVGPEALGGSINKLYSYDSTLKLTVDITNPLDPSPSAAYKSGPVRMARDGSSVMHCSYPFGSISSIRTNDLCVDNATKTDPGVCGCNLSDLDSDGDGSLNCNDVCPSDNSKSSDSGQCGCGKIENDSDGDGLADCVDPDPSHPGNSTPGDGEDNPDDGDDTTPTKSLKEIAPEQARLLVDGKGALLAYLEDLSQYGVKSYRTTFSCGAGTKTVVSNRPKAKFTKPGRGNCSVIYSAQSDSQTSKKSIKAKIKLGKNK